MERKLNYEVRTEAKGVIKKKKRLMGMIMAENGDDFCDAILCGIQER